MVITSYHMSLSLLCEFRIVLEISCDSAVFLLYCFCFCIVFFLFWFRIGKQILNVYIFLPSTLFVVALSDGPSL